MFKHIKYLHKVERVIRNRDLDAPTFAEMSLLIEDLNTGWYVAPPYFNFFHDNREDLPEIKFINLDGREYVYSADDSGYYKVILDFKLRGSYNYSPPIIDKRKSILYKIIFIPKVYFLHFILDILPEIIFK